MSLHGHVWYAGSIITVLTLEHRHHILAREAVEEWFNRGCVYTIEEANLNWANGT